jgi:mono/diheme cytochrome c family protein
MPGVFPPIAGDPVVNAEDASEHIDIVLHGLLGKEIGGVAYVSPMPAFGGQLSDEQIAAVINHQRTSFGNHAPLVAAEEVAAHR